MVVGRPISQLSFNGLTLYHFSSLAANSAKLARHLAAASLDAQRLTPIDLVLCGQVRQTEMTLTLRRRMPVLAAESSQTQDAVITLK